MALAIALSSTAIIVASYSIVVLSAAIHPAVPKFESAAATSNQQVFDQLSEQVSERVSKHVSEHLSKQLSE